MPWIEKIEIRSLKTCCAEWLKTINDVARDITQTDPNISVEILRNASVETDLVIELTHHSGEAVLEGSSIGVRLASMCASLGMVNHSIWMDESRHVDRKKEVPNPGEDKKE